MKTPTLTITAVTVALLGQMTLAAERVQSQYSRLRTLKPSVSLTIPTTEYLVQVAEPVPETLFVLEVRYLETSSQGGSDWFIMATNETDGNFDDTILWVALHLVAEWRVVETHPVAQWQTVGTFSSYSAAAAEEAIWETMGYWTTIITRRTSIPQSKLPSVRRR